MGVAVGVVVVGAVFVVVVVVAELARPQKDNPKIVLQVVVPSCKGAPASWYWNVSR